MHLYGSCRNVPLSYSNKMIPSYQSCCILCYYDVGITVGFSQSTYSIYEHDGAIQPVLLLSRPSSTNITVQVQDNGNTANGVYITT